MVRSAKNHRPGKTWWPAINASECAWLVTALVIGIAYAGYILGVGFISNSSNLLYISDDMQQHFLGWHLYRYDHWYWPLTLTQRLEYPQFTAIVFTDSLPLLSMVLKALSPLLPKLFIWHGLVAILNCSLQFYFATILLRQLRQDNWLAFIGGLFFVFATILTFRLFRHYALTSQWLILWSLALIFKQKITNSELKQNLAIIFLASGTHAYILAMNLALASALFYKYLHQNPQNLFKSLLKHLIYLSLVLIFSLYFFGYFSLDGDSGSSGWGLFALNLNAWVNPLNYSSFMPALPLVSDIQGLETFQYLGLGILLALIPALANIIYFKPQWLKLTYLIQSPYLGLALVSIILVLFSLSTTITLNSWTILNLTELKQNSYLTTLFATLRASARMSWPVFYLIMLLAIVGSYDLFCRLNKIFAPLILSLLFLLQAADLFQLRQEIRNMVSHNLLRPAWNADLHDQWWQNNLNIYQHLIVLFPYEQVLDNNYAAYFKFGMLAAEHNLTLNSFYLSRGANTNYFKQVNDFASNRLAPNSLYIVPQQLIVMLDQQLLQYCKRIDDYYVCTRNWN